MSRNSHPQLFFKDSLNKFFYYFFTKKVAIYLRISGLKLNIQSDQFPGTLSPGCPCRSRHQHVTHTPDSCAVPAVIASNFVLVQGVTAGTTSTAANLAQNQLPNATLSGTTNAAGDHQHYLVKKAIGLNNITDNAAFVNQTLAVWYDWGGSSNIWNYRLQSRTEAADSGLSATAGSHTHTVTTSSINCGVAQQALTSTNLPRLNVNDFVCVN